MKIGRITLCYWRDPVNTPHTCLDPEKVWTALMADPAFDDVRFVIRPLLREMVNDLPNVLAEHCGKPVTIQAVLEAKLAALRHLRTARFVERLLDHLPDAVPENLSKGEVLAAMLELLDRSIADFARVIGDADEILKAAGFSESESLLHPRFGGLMPSTMKALRTSTHTIGSLIELQPSVVVHLPVF
jgi:hypothetical protein